ncbi:MAG: hypothetical protein QME51_08995, partial [Planctomycetota bacterium]|nr:hypothetical protein [Planctomycetota bacterium]
GNGGRLGRPISNGVHTFTEPGQYWLKMSLEMDNLSIDDSRLHLVEVQEGVNILIINGEPSAEPSEDEVLYLRYALVPSTSKDLSSDNISSYSLNVITSAQIRQDDKILSADSLEKYHSIILANVDFLTAEQVEIIEDFVANGGGLLIFLGDKVNKVAYNELLYKSGRGLLPYALGDIKGDSSHNEPTKFAEIDFFHPAMSFFSSVKEKFGTLSVYQYYELLTVPKGSGPEDNKSSIIARLHKPDQPALIVEKPYDNGRVILIATSADSEWNLMPVRPMYVMLVDRLVMYLATFSNRTNQRNILVGEPIVLSVRDDEQKNYTLRLPKKDSVSLEPSLISDSPQKENDNNQQRKQYRLTYAHTSEAGLYTLSSGKDETYFAVNVSPQEGDIRRIKDDELKNLIPFIQIQSLSDPDFIGADLSDSIQGDAPRIDLSSNPLWKYLLYLFLILILTEALLAWRFGRR